MSGPVWRESRGAAKRVALGAVAGLAALGLVAGPAPSCQAQGDAAAQVIPCDCCMSDPASHCVALLGCADDRQCPAGTICTTGFPSYTQDRREFVPAAFRTCADTITGDRWCGAVQNVDGLSALLVSGFDVEELSLTKTTPPSGSTELTWSAPPETVLVTCALFGCPPLILPSPTQTDLEGNPVRAILNFDQCVLYSDQFGFANSTFALGRIPEAPPGPRGDTCAADRAGPGGGKRVLSALAAGCWAYDDAGMIRASRLIDIDPAEVPPDNAFVKTSCAEGSGSPTPEGWSCLVPQKELRRGELRAFGTCHLGQCARRCIGDVDCLRFAALGAGDGGAGGSSGTGSGGSGGAAQGGGGGSGTACDAGAPCTGTPVFRCVRQDVEQYLGVCEKQAPPAQGTGGGP